MAGYNRGRVKLVGRGGRGINVYIFGALIIIP